MVNIARQSLTTSLDGVNSTFVSGKGGVGKSVIAAALAYYQMLTLKKNVIHVDIDSAHSGLDSLGFDEAETDLAELHNTVRSIGDKLRVLLMSPVLPKPRDINELNAFISTFLKDEGLLPLLRLAIHSYFFGIRPQYKATSYVYQLIELLTSGTYYEANHNPGLHDIERKDFDIDLSSPKTNDSVVIDSENTQGLLDIIGSLQYLEHSLQNIHAGNNAMFDARKWPMKATLATQPNLAAYADSSIGCNPDETIAIMREFCDHVYGTKTAAVIVSRPTRNDVRQTLREMRELTASDLSVAHILMNRWPHDPQPTDFKWEQRLLDGVSQMPSSQTIGYSHVPHDPTIDVDPDADEFQTLCLEGLRRVGESFACS